MTLTKYPDGNTTVGSGADNVQMTYHLDGALKTRTDQQGVVMTYSYDSARRLSLEGATTIPSGVDDTIKSIGRTYDNLGRVTKITSYPAANGTGTPENEIKYTYHSTLGHLQKSEQSHQGAVTGGTSDVHIQPYESRLVVRFRIDGILFDAFDVPKPLQEEVVSRIKVIGKMNIAEKRLPQDGRATVQVGDRRIDLRIASLPGSHGERVVLRLLDKSARLYTLPEIGMDREVLVRFREAIRLEHGLILVTGPTGSGKSTTLYGALQEINSRESNIVTLEDPIEYQIDGISQTQINTKKGLTFAAGLRSVLRQDPDVIMVGEIRDHETAVMAIQSALTGHLVFSTLHTNDAASAVTRLLDLGIEPYLVSSSLLAVMAQRLVRKVCQDCAEQRPPSREEVNFLTHDSQQSPLPRGEGKGEGALLTHGRGCSNCRETGYRGRVGIFELLMVDDPVRSKIQDRSNASEIRDVGLQRGMHLLRDDGVRKILQGSTTVDEVSRVTVRAAM